MSVDFRKNKFAAVFSIILTSICATVAYAENMPANASNPKYVESIAWAPIDQNVKIGQQITFTEVTPINAENNTNDLLYSILIASTDNPVWETVVPYQPWPLPKIYFNREGIYSVQINVLKKDTDSANLAPQGIWLTQFIVKTAA